MWKDHFKTGKTAFKSPLICAILGWNHFWTVFCFFKGDRNVKINLIVLLTSQWYYLITLLAAKQYYTTEESGQELDVLHTLTKLVLSPQWKCIMFMGSHKLRNHSPCGNKYENCTFPGLQMDICLMLQDCLMSQNTWKVAKFPHKGNKEQKKEQYGSCPPVISRMGWMWKSLNRIQPSEFILTTMSDWSKVGRVVVWWCGGRAALSCGSGEQT